MVSNNNLWLTIAIVGLSSLSSFSFIFSAFGQEGEGGQEELLIRRVEIWSLFYRLMVVAFIVGAVVQGSIVYVIWRFRESNKKNQLGDIKRVEK